MNFKVGEKVIALNDSGHDSCMERISGTVYTVTAAQYCHGCGKQHININHKSPAEHALEFYCTSCYAFSPTNSRGWAGSENFTRAISNEYKLEVSIPELLEIKIPQLQ